PHFIEGNEHPPFRNLERIQWHLDQPAYGPNCDMVWSIYESARLAGVSVLLDGHDGDTTVSYGDRYLHELARAGRRIALASELRGVARLDGPPAWESFGSFAWHYRLNPAIDRHRSLRLARHLWRRATPKTSLPKSPARWQALLNANLTDEINMRERYRRWRQSVSHTASTERDTHYRMLTHPTLSFPLELHPLSAPPS